MKEIIERLRKYANANIADGEPMDSSAVIGSSFGVIITNREALQIADALEVAMYPPIVRAVLAWLECGKTELDWVAVDCDGEVFEYQSKPILNATYWTPDADKCRTLFVYNGHFDHKYLSFHRTANGWEWYGNPNKQNIEQYGK